MRFQYRLAFLPLLACLVSSACDESPGPTSGISTTDSAGVEIVHYGGATLAGAPRLSVEEVVRIGTLEGPEETQFFRIGWAIESAGELFVLDRGDQEIRVFDLDGNFLRAFGGAGDGPGEFRGAMVFAVKGDTVAVVGQRLDILDRHGSALATGPGMLQREDGLLHSTLPTASGWMAQHSTSRSRKVDRGQSFQETVTVFKVDPLTAEAGEAVFSYEWIETIVAANGMSMRPMIQAVPLHVIGPDGTVYFTPADRYQIDAISGTTGKLVRRIQSDMKLPPVTPELIDKAVAAEREYVKDARPGSSRARYAENIDEILALPIPETLPVIGWMHPSESGWLLVSRLDLDEDPINSGNPSAWDLFDPDGKLRGRLELTPNTRVLTLTDDGLLAVVRDEMDVESLVKYRFRLHPEDVQG